MQSIIFFVYYISSPPPLTLNPSAPRLMLIPSRHGMDFWSFIEDSMFLFGPPLQYIIP